MKALLTSCRERGLRITAPLKAILKALKNAALPVSIADLELKVSSCDRTTIFRTLQRLDQAGLVRRLNFSERRAKFTLKTGNEHKEYLICEGCGKVEALDIVCPVHEIEQDLMEKTGFRKLTHELEFYGLCPQCDHPAHSPDLSCKYC